MKNEINGLFQKFIDNSINAEELERFLALLNDRESARQIRQLVAGLWDYLALTEDQQSDQFSETARSLLRKKQRLLEKLIEENDRKHREVMAAFKKVKKESKKKQPKNRKCSFCQWFKRLFLMV